MKVNKYRDLYLAMLYHLLLNIHPGSYPFEGGKCEIEASAQMCGEPLLKGHVTQLTKAIAGFQGCITPE